MQLDRPSARLAGRTGRLPTLGLRKLDWSQLLKWEAPTLIAILGTALALSVWRLDQNGWANEYYSAAALSASQSWKAFFFGSLDAANFITVDKPPLAVWPQALAVRLFGFSAWSVLLPQAVFSVLSVAVLYRVVRMTAGAVAAAIAAAAFAVSPISVAVGRDNIPEPLLVLLLLLGAWALVSATKSGRLLPLVLCAVAVGLAFNTKMLQAYLVLPAFGPAYLVCAAGSVRARIAKLLVAGGVLAGVSMLWIGMMTAVPQDSRPYIGSSTDNTALNLVTNYNGIGRLTGGDDTPGPGLGNAGPHYGGDAAIDRLFNPQLEGEVSWLIPTSLFAIAAAFTVAFRKRRTNDAWIGAILWTGWFGIHAAVFSLQKGIFHPYYTAALAPSIAALMGIGAVATWRLSKGSAWWAAAAAGAIIGGALWARNVLSDDPGTDPWQTTAVVAAGLIAALAWVGASLAHRRGQTGRDGASSNEWLDGPLVTGTLMAITLVSGGIALLSAPAAFALNPLDSPVQGVNPTATPVGFGRTAFGSGGARGFQGPNGRPSGINQAGSGAAGGSQNQGGTAAGGQNPSRSGQIPSQTGPPTRPGGQPAPLPGRGFVPPGGGAGPAGPRVVPGQNTASSVTSVADFLVANSHGERWLAATTDATSASRLIIATRRPVMGMGGFNSTDLAPTVDELARYVAAGDLRYVVLGGTGGFGLNGQGDRANWVRANCKLVAAGPATAQANGQGAGGFRGGSEQVWDCKVTPP